MAKRYCQDCASVFETSHLRKLFCSDRCRIAYHRTHALTCFYCGDVGPSKDHLYPQCFGGGVGDTVLACQECNGTAQALTDLEERILFIHDQYTKKYQLDKQMPEWTDYELKTLGRTLRASIKAKLGQRRKARERVVHLQARLREVQRLGHTTHDKIDR